MLIKLYDTYIEESFLLETSSAQNIVKNYDKKGNSKIFYKDETYRYVKESLAEITKKQNMLLK